MAANSQSITLPLTENGALVSATGWIPGGSAFGVAIGSDYSIAGVLNFGASIGARIDTADSSVRSDISAVYSVAAMKQSTALPFSFEVYGTFSYQDVTSPFLSRNRLLTRAQGYTLGVALVRDFFFTRSFSFRLAGVGEYHRLSEETTVAFDATGYTGLTEVHYDQYPQVSLDAGFQYGGYAGLLFRGEKLAVGLGASIVTDLYLVVEYRPAIQILIGE